MGIHMQTCHLDLMCIYEARPEEIKWKTNVNVQEGELQRVVVAGRKANTPVK